MKHRLTASDGFTLLETLVVITISLIMLAVALPDVMGSIEAYRLNASARMVGGRLLEARVNAIKRSRAAQLTIDPANRDVRIETTDDAGNLVQVGAREALAQGVRFVAPAATAQVVFDASGRPAGAVQIQLAPAGANRVVTVTLTASGNIRVG